jgi:hypothetical protein
MGNGGCVARVLTRWLAVVFIAFATPSCTSHVATADVPFDRLELVLRLDMEPGGGPETYFASDDGSSTWVEASATPDRGYGIFLAEASLRVRVPEDDSGELRLEKLAVRLVSDEYTKSGWLMGARLDFLGEGRAELEERRDEASSFWRVVAMPPLVLTDAARTVEGTFDWVAEAPTEATEPEVWFDTGELFPSVYVHFVSYRRRASEAAP